MSALHDVQRNFIQMNAWAAGHGSCYQKQSEPGPFNLDLTEIFH